MSLPFVPAGAPRPLLRKNAPAPQQFSRLLDALLLLDAQQSCSVAELAARVGLEPDRMRELLSTFMVAGAEALGPDAPFNLDFGTEEGSLGTGVEDDEAQAGAGTVRLSSLRGSGQSLLQDVGRRPVTVRDVARAVLAAELLVQTGQLPEAQRLGVEALAAKLSAAMRASVAAPASSTAAALRQAVAERRRVRFRYLHPWTGAPSEVDTDPYDVRRQRDRLVLDAAGTPFTTYDVGGISHLESRGPAGAYELPALPDPAARTAAVQVVLRVPYDSGQEQWLTSGWSGTVVDRVGDDVHVRVQLDGDAADPGVVQRLGVLLMQLGPVAGVVGPQELRAGVAPVARRLLDQHAD